ncbi:hypothetical protein LTR29_015905 [Friedmanniomyces endolithicus]|nr:hypothetical protein LTR29_015905 [Friedmanniomyces endolithicus]
MTEPTEQGDHGPSDSEGLADPYTSFPPFTLEDFIDVPDSPQPPGIPPNYWEGPYNLLPYQLPSNLFPDPPAYNPGFPPFTLGDLIHLPDSPEPSSNIPTSLDGDIPVLPSQWPADLFPEPPEPNPDGAFLLACPPLDTVCAISFSENDMRRLLSDYHDSLDTLNYPNPSAGPLRDPALAPSNSQRAHARDCLLIISEAVIKIFGIRLRAKQALLEESGHWLRRAQRLQTADVVSPEAQSMLKDSFRRQWEDTWAKMEEMEGLKQRHEQLREEYTKVGGSVSPRLLFKTESGPESDNLYARIWGMQSLFAEKGERGVDEDDEDDDEDEDDDDSDDDSDGNEDDESEESGGYDPWAYWEKEVEDDAVTEEDDEENEDEEEERVNLFTGETVRPYPRGSWETQPRPSLPVQREESVMDLLAMQHAAFPSHERARNDPATWRPYTRSSGYGVEPSRLATIPEEEYHNPDDYLPLFLTAFEGQMSMIDPLMDVELAVSNERGAMDIDEDRGGEEQVGQVSKKGKERAVDPEPPERSVAPSPAHAQPPAKRGIRLAKPFFQKRSAAGPLVDTQSRVKPPFKLRVMNPDQQPQQPNATEGVGAQRPEGVHPELGRRARQLLDDEWRFRKRSETAMPSGGGPSAARSSAARSSKVRSSASGPSARRPSAALPSTARPSAAHPSTAGPSTAGPSALPVAPGLSRAAPGVQPAFNPTEPSTTAQPQDSVAVPPGGSNASPATAPVIPAEYMRNGTAYRWVAGIYQRKVQSEEYPIDVD